MMFARYLARRGGALGSAALVIRKVGRREVSCARPGRSLGKNERQLACALRVLPFTGKGAVESASRSHGQSQRSLRSYAILTPSRCGASVAATKFRGGRRGAVRIMYN